MRPNVTKRPRRNYANGANAERECRKDWEALGYTVVRSAGSKGAADLVCVREREGITGCEVVFVSVKRGTGRVDAAQRARLLALPGNVYICHRQQGGAWREERVK